MGGSSSGTLLAAALKYCREQTTPKKVVVFVCDTGNKYLSKMYNDYWMLDNGFLEREAQGDLSRSDPAPLRQARHRGGVAERYPECGLSAHEDV